MAKAMQSGGMGFDYASLNKTNKYLPAQYGSNQSHNSYML